MHVAKRLYSIVCLTLLAATAIATRVSPVAAEQDQGETSPWSYNVYSTSWWCSTSTSVCQHFSPNETSYSGVSAHGCVSLLTGWVSVEAVDAWCADTPWS